MASEHKETNKDFNQALDWISGIDLEEPIIPVSSRKAKRREKLSKRYTSEGWKFYTKLKDQLPDLWHEFNGRMDKKNKPYYKNLKQFAHDHFKKYDERKYFRLMTGTKTQYNAGAHLEDSTTGKKVVPWLGDWLKRRQNGYWATENGLQVRGLAKALRENVEKNEAIRASAPFLVQEMLRYTRLQEKIDKAFGGEPFLDESPVSKNNAQRFHCYIGMLKAVTVLKTKLIHEWMRVHGVDPHSPHEMWDMATLAASFGQVGASAALTGAYANQQLQNLPPGSNIPMLPGINVSADALRLAAHLSKHQEDFGKPLNVPVVDGEVIKEKANGKSNGKKYQ